MLPSSDPLGTREQGGARGGYQTIESGTNTSQPSGDINQPTFLAQIKDAKEQSQGCCDFCMTFFGILVGSLVWLLVLAITFTLPVVMIVLGALYFHDCPKEPMIPIFNLVAGCVILVTNVLNTVVRVNRFQNASMPRKPTAIGWITTILNIFLLGWFIVGCYWVYGGYPQSDKECQLTLYSFSFWLLNACFIFFASMVITASVMMCLALICF